MLGKRIRFRKPNHITMRYLVLIFLMQVALITACTMSPRRELLLSKVENEMEQGNFIYARHLADSLTKAFPDDTVLAARFDSLKDQTRRISFDFSLSEAEVHDRLYKMQLDYSPEELQLWEDKNWLEYRIIEGEKRYFKRSAGNLKRILDHGNLLQNPEKQEIPGDFEIFKIEQAKAVIGSAGNDTSPVEPVSMRLKYTLTVEADAVPAGETIRCWMPWPREIHPRQQEIRLIGTFPEAYYLAPDTVPHRSLYMEQPAATGQPTVFEMEFSYCSFAQYVAPHLINASSGEKERDVYSGYTREQKPHIVFTGKIRELADQIAGDETDPLKIVQSFFYWIDRNIPWAGALEYSIIPNIPEYVIDNRRGDCGMKTLLFMTLARYRGIPVKWQSGWMLHPGEVNLHDWCEVWYDGVGWVPLDMSFGRLPSTDPAVRDFYMTGIDSWRLIVNDATGAPFVPAKRFPRSEPNDFQRGEVEWRQGNLYFDKWNYQMEVQYLPELIIQKTNL